MNMITKKNKNTMKNIDYYLNLPWTYTIESDVDENGKHLFVIRVNEIPRIVADAHTIEQAMQKLKDVMPVVFEMYMEQGDEIPEPIDESQYQGNIAYRTTPRKHYLIAKEAQKKRQSLSQTIDALIDAGLAAIKK